MKKRYIIFSVLALIFSGCASTPENFFPANLAGIIFDNYSSPIAGATVTVDSDKEYTTDIDGRFIIPELKEGQYQISITKPGFETIETEIDFFDPKQVLYLKMSSMAYFRNEIESNIKKRDYEKAEKLLSRAFKIDEDDPVLYYLAAVCSYYEGRYSESKEYIAVLRKSGYSIDAITKLEQKIEEKEPSQ